jgi:hypothetical protein
MKEVRSNKIRKYTYSILGFTWFVMSCMQNNFYDNKHNNIIGEVHTAKIAKYTYWVLGR